MSPPRTSPSPWHPSWRSKRMGSASPSETPITRRRCHAPSACPREEAPCEHGVMGLWALGGSWRHGPADGETVPWLWSCRAVRVSPVLHLSRLVCSKQWWLSPAGLGKYVDTLCRWREGYSRRKERRGACSLPWVISLLEDFLCCQKPPHSWDDLRHPLIL